MMRKQGGMTAIGWLIVIGLVGVQAVMALRIIPVYMNYGSAKSIVDAMQSNPDIKGKTPKQVRSLINKRFEVNSLTELLNNKDAIKFKKTKTGLKLIMNYESRGPIFGNLDFVVTFNHEVDLPTR